MNEYDDERMLVEFQLERLQRELAKNALLGDREQLRSVAASGTFDDDNDVFEDIEYEFIEDKADALKRDRLLEDFGRNFHGYISRPGENMTSISEKKIKSEFSRTSLQRSSRVKRTDPRVKRLRAVEDLKEQTLIEAEIDRFRMRSSQYVDNDGQQEWGRPRKTRPKRNVDYPVRWGPGVKQKAKNRSILDDFNYFNILLPALRDQKQIGNSVSHKDARGVFLNEDNREELLARLLKDRNGESGDGSDAESTYIPEPFAPDGNFRTALTMPESSEAMLENAQMSRYVKSNKKRFFDEEIRASALFSHDASSSSINSRL